MQKYDPSRRKFIKKIVAGGVGTAVLGTGIYKISNPNSKNKQKNNAELYDPERLDDLPDRAFGMDISHHNELDIDKFYKEVQLKKVNDNKKGTIPVNFIYLRIGQGLYKDKGFKKNWETVKKYNKNKNISNKLKMATGIYYYYKYDRDPVEQAEKLISLLNEHGGDIGQLIPMIDIEQRYKDTKKIKPPKTAKKDLKILLDMVENEFGVTPGIYSGLSFFQDYLDGGKPNGEFNEYKQRIANYRKDYVETKKNVENKLGYTPTIIQWSEDINLPGTGNSDGDTDATDTENLPELFIKNNLVGNKYNPQGEEEGQEGIDIEDTTGISGGKLGSILGGLAMATASILHYSRDKNKTDRRTFIKKAMKTIAATIGGALTGALIGSQIEKYSSLDMKFEGISKCTITLDEKEIILFRNILPTGFGMTVQSGGEVSSKIPIENREKIEDFIKKEFDGFSFSNRDRKKILKNMKLVPNEENDQDAALIAMASIFDIEKMPYTAETYNSNNDEWKRQQPAMNDAKNPLIETAGTKIKEYKNLDDIIRFTNIKKGRLEKVEDTGDHYFIRKNQIHKDRRVLNPKALKNMEELFKRANKYLRKDFGLSNKYHIKYPIHSLTRDIAHNTNEGGSDESTHLSGLAVDITTVNSVLPMLYEGNSHKGIKDQDTHMFKKIAHAALYKAASEMKDEGKIIPNKESNHLHIMLYTGKE